MQILIFVTNLITLPIKRISGNKTWRNVQDPVKTVQTAALAMVLHVQLLFSEQLVHV